MTSWHEPERDRPRDAQDWLELFLLALGALGIAAIFFLLGGSL